MDSMHQQRYEHVDAAVVRTVDEQRLATFTMVLPTLCCHRVTQLERTEVKACPTQQEEEIYLDRSDDESRWRAVIGGGRRADIMTTTVLTTAERAPSRPYPTGHSKGFLQL